MQVCGERLTMQRLTRGLGRVLGGAVPPATAKAVRAAVFSRCVGVSVARNLQFLRWVVRLWIRVVMMPWNFHLHFARIWLSFEDAQHIVFKVPFDSCSYTR